MRFIEKLLSDLVRDRAGIDARRVIRRIGGKRLLMMGGLAAAGALLNQKSASGAGAATAASGGTPASPRGYAYTKGQGSGAHPAPRAGAVSPPPPGQTGAPPSRPDHPAAASAAERPTGPPAGEDAWPAPPGAVPPPPGAPSAAAPAAAPTAPETNPERDAMDHQPTPDAVSAALDAADGADLPDELSYAAIRVMVAAALADGHLVAQERSAVERHVEDAELTPEQEAQIRRDLVLPATVEELVALATGPADREVLYQLASVVLHADGQLGAPEATWLERLGTAFGLSPERRDELDAGVRASLGG